MAKRESSPGISPAKKRIRYRSGSNFNAEYTRTFDWVMASSRRTARFAVSISASLTAGLTTSWGRQKAFRTSKQICHAFFFRNLTCLDILFLEIMFLFFKNTAKKLKIQAYILPILSILTNYQYQNNSIYVKNKLSNYWRDANNYQQ